MMSLPTELLGCIASFLHLGDVNSVITSYAGRPHIIEFIKSSFLRKNLKYLLTTQNTACWKKRRSNTITWMKYNDWKSMFHQQGIGSSPQDPLIAHDCCKPFYDLNASVERGIPEITQFLLESFDVNEEVTTGDAYFETSHRPITVALTIPSSEMLKLLLTDKDIEINCPFQRAFGSTLLHFAAVDERVSKEHFGILLEHLTPNDINGRDSSGKTPLHYAVWFLRECCEDKVEMLLKAGANANTFCLDYVSPLQLLEEAGIHHRKNIDDIEVLLKRYGAFTIRIGP